MESPRLASYALFVKEVRGREFSYTYALDKVVFQLGAVSKAEASALHGTGSASGHQEIDDAPRTALISFVNHAGRIHLDLETSFTVVDPGSLKPTAPPEEHHLADDKGDHQRNDDIVAASDFGDGHVIKIHSVNSGNECRWQTNGGEDRKHVQTSVRSLLEQSGVSLAELSRLIFETARHRLGLL